MIELKPGHLYLLGITIAILVFTTGYCVWEAFLHYIDDPVFTQQVGLIGLMVSPVLAFLVPKQIKTRNGMKWMPWAATIVDADVFEYEYVDVFDNDKVKRTGGTDMVIITAASCTLLNLVINAVGNLTRGLTFQLQPVEIYLFYAAISVAEECTFRILIVSAITGMVAAATRSSTKYQRGAVIFAAIVSGVMFGMAHIPAYGKTAPHMIWVTGIGGVSMALFYGFTKNPLVPIVAHLVNNLIASSFVFNSSIMIPGIIIWIPGILISIFLFPVMLRVQKS